MNCEQIREILADLGGDAEYRQRLRAALNHLEDCAGCQDAIAGYDRIASVLHGEADDKTAEAWSVPERGWDAFQARLEMTAARSPTAISTRNQAASRGMKRRYWLQSIAGIAACLLVAAGAYRLGRHDSMAPSPADPSVQTSAVAGPVAPSDAEVIRQVKAFGAVDQVFEGRTVWLMFAGQSTDVGLDESTKPLTTRPSGQRIMLVRLNVIHDGKVVSNADVAILAGSTADMKIATNDGASMRYRIVTSSRTSGGVGLRAELSDKDGNKPEASLATDLRLDRDRTVSAGQLVSFAGTYEVKVAYADAPL